MADPTKTNGREEGMDDAHALLREFKNLDSTPENLVRIGEIQKTIRTMLNDILDEKELKSSHGIAGLHMSTNGNYQIRENLDKKDFADTIKELFSRDLINISATTKKKVFDVFRQGVKKDAEKPADKSDEKKDEEKKPDDAKKEEEKKPDEKKPEELMLTWGGIIDGAKFWKWPGKAISKLSSTPGKAKRALEVAPDRTAKGMIRLGKFLWKYFDASHEEFAYKMPKKKDK